MDISVFRAPGDMGCSLFLLLIRAGCFLPSSGPQARGPRWTGWSLFLFALLGNMRQCWRALWCCSGCKAGFARPSICCGFSNLLATTPSKGRRLRSLVWEALSGPDTSLCWFLSWEQLLPCRVASLLLLFYTREASLRPRSHSMGQ